MATRCLSAPLRGLGDWRVVSAVVLLRALNSATLSTSSAPDENWQGPEVAHRLVFGYGELTWEWRPGARLRSLIHPLLLALPMWLLKALVSAPARPARSFRETPIDWMR